MAMCSDREAVVSRNTLDRVNLTPRAVAAWHAVANVAAATMRGVSDIPNEDA